MKRTLIIMVKEPRPGRVKTRLGRDIGVIPATWWFRHQSARLIRRLSDPRWQIVLAVAPDLAVRSKVWPADLPRWPQGPGDLGARMKRMLQSATGPICLIGADIPGISRTHIARAFAALGDHDAVFGPAADGGYWLVGAKHPSRLPKDMFKGVRWSSEYALADTLNTLPGWRTALTDTLQDVDTAADLPRR
ncbi:TIGR04282 family arsenosugar biosynthesis glycosyltransferase [Leisingera sp. SS27]|uniref:TIGR04282 family arsenosugar biosynthesis glycosyltransferase n=1 Tax=Leisingera sp. SS27 TaxID=2979462 RepID=UPI00232DDD66|nr:TIGR04282 family arsenosugar biosynthesis glycosyltransferase [Leisingera sp. SS27]MDC0660174.1 TIGR04282 family arsenosugar biosynthesis glycosyltransferase [Leisingera sp. SS27]